MTVAAIPVELRERPQWVVWRRARRHNGKWTKVPYRAADARTKAETDNPRTWGTFEQALARAAEVQGYGYVFSADDPYTGVDLDDCIDTQTGELHPAAVEILAELGGYQERSPSGQGMHVFIAAKLTRARKTPKTPWGGLLEIYDRGRFFTVTGNGGGTITDRQAQLDAVIARMFPPTASNGTGREPLQVPTEPLAEGEGRHNYLVEVAKRLPSAGILDPDDIEAILAVMFTRRCKPLPPPQPNEFHSIAEWAVGSDIANRERERAEKEAALPDEGWWVHGD